MQHSHDRVERFLQRAGLWTPLRRSRHLQENHTMTAPLGMGVVGAGSIGIRAALMHLSLPDVQDRVTLAAVCDPVPGRAQAAAEKFGVKRGYEKLRRPAGRPERPRRHARHPHRAALRTGDAGDPGRQARPLQQDHDDHGGRSHPVDRRSSSGRGQARRLARPDDPPGQQAPAEDDRRRHAGPARLGGDRRGVRRLPRAGVRCGRGRTS